jgi:hypothetical protein
MFLPQGTPLPLKNEMIYSDLPKDSMYIFANSYASPDCCPSTFSTDRGCVCTSDFQRKYIGEQRGLNKSYENYNFLYKLSKILSIFIYNIYIYVYYK